MNLEAMETALKRYGFDSKDPLAMWINAAMHEIEDDFDWPWLEGEQEVKEYPANTQFASIANSLIPANVVKVITIKDETNIYKLKYYDWRKFERDIREPEEKGLPEIWTLTSTNAVQLWRVLEQPTRFRFRFQYQTLDLVNPTDEPTTANHVWPPNMSFPIVQRAAVIALYAENEEDRAKAIQQDFDQTLMRLKLRYGARELDEPETVQDVQGYGSESPMRWIN